jgi:hypothetical protein
VLIDLASVAVAGPETFTLALESITGPGSLYFETHGIGSQAQCAGVDETEENDVATPTVRADPAGFQLLPVASLACPGPGTGGDLADSRGIRFTASKPFGLVALSFSGTEGNYSFDAELRRSSGFTAPVEATASATARFPSIGLLPNPSALIDFGNVAVTGPETFTLRVLNVAGPGVLYWETHGIGSQTQCADVDETEENDVAVPTVRADPAGFALFAPEPSAALGCWLAAISLATLARVAPRRRMPR